MKLSKMIILIAILLVSISNSSSFAIYVGDIEYQNNGDGTATVIGSTGAATVIVVPQTIVDGSETLTVVEVADNALKIKNLTSVTLPDTVKRIGVAALAANQLTSFDFPDQLEELGGASFAQNPLSGTIVLPSNLKKIGNLTFYVTQATEVHFPRGIEEVGEWGFWLSPIERFSFYPTPDAANPTALKRIRKLTFGQPPGNGLQGDITIPEGVEVIESESFRNNFQMTNVYLPNTLKEIQANAFLNTGTTVKVHLPANPPAVQGHSVFWKDSNGATYTPGVFIQEGSNNFAKSYELNYLLDGSIAISGTTAYNEVLSANPTITYTGPLNYQWLRDDVAISGATNSTYQLTLDDIGAQISLRIGSTTPNADITSAKTSVITKSQPTPTKGVLPIVYENRAIELQLNSISGYEYAIVADGVSVATATWQDTPIFTGLNENTKYDIYQRVKETSGYFASAISDKLDVTTKIVLTGSVTITGTSIYGQTLNAVPTTNNSGVYQYQWLRNNVIISGASNSSYLISVDDVGQQLSVQVGSNIEYGSVVSNQTASVTKQAYSGSVLNPIFTSATSTSIQLANQAAYEYTLVANGAGVVGAVWQDSPVLTSLLEDTDYDVYQRVKETATTLASSSSQKLDVKTKKTLTGSVSINGSVIYNETLSAVVTTNNSGNHQYQWQRNNVAIPGATNSSYQLGQSDIGQQISVVVSSDVEYGTISSNQTASVTKQAYSGGVLLPVSINTSATDIQLKTYPGYEYQINNGPWTTNPIFANLQPNTIYTINQRVAESNTTLASSKSQTITFATQGLSSNKSSSSSSADASSTNTTQSFTRTVSFSSGKARVDGMIFDIGRKIHVLEEEENIINYMLYDHEVVEMTKLIGENSDIFMIFESKADTYKVDYENEALKSLIDTNQVMKHETSDLTSTVHLGNLDLTHLGVGEIDYSNLKLTTRVEKYSPKETQVIVDKLGEKSKILAPPVHISVTYNYKNQKETLHEASDVIEHHLPVNKNVSIDPSKTRVFIMDTDGDIYYIPYKVSENNGVKTIDFQSNGFGTVGLIEVDEPPAITTNHWAKKSVEELVNQGMADVSIVDTLDKEISREDFVVLLAKSTGMLPTKQVFFQDLDDGSLNSRYINVSKKVGIVNGLTENTFGSGAHLTREDLMTMVYRFVNRYGTENINDEDIAKIDINRNQPSAYARDAVAWFVKKGYIVTTDDESLRLHENTTVAEGITLLHRVFY